MDKPNNCTECDHYDPYQKVCNIMPGVPAWMAEPENSKNNRAEHCPLDCKHD